MGRYSSSSSSDRRQWQRIFRAMVEMLQGQQSQIETLVGDRKFLQDYIHIHHDRCLSKTRLLESHISQMKKEVEMARRVQAAKLDLMVGLKQRETLFYKDQFEHAEFDLEDFHVCVEALNSQISRLKDMLEDKRSIEPCKGMREEGGSMSVEIRKEVWHTPMLEGELKKWKHAYKKLSSKKETEVSALLAEKDFVWNQFKKMESDYIDLLKRKQVELEQANEAIEKFQPNIEKLQSSAVEKDETIVKLKADLVSIELELRNRTGEAQRSSEKLEKLQLDMEKLQCSLNEKDKTIAKLGSDLAKLEMNVSRFSNGKTRVLKELGSLTNTTRYSSRLVGRHPGVDSGKDGSGSGSSCVIRKQFHVYNDSSGSRTSDTGLKRCSKRKSAATAIFTLEGPRLFTSTFKVPKLKDFSLAHV